MYQITKYRKDLRFTEKIHRIIDRFVNSRGAAEKLRAAPICREPTAVSSHLLADVLPLAVELVQQLLDVEGEGRLRLLLQVEAHLVDAVDAGLDGVDVVDQRLV